MVWWWGKTRCLYGSAASLTQIQWASYCLECNSERIPFNIKFTPLVELKSQCLISIFFHKHGMELKDKENAKPKSFLFSLVLDDASFLTQTSLWGIKGFILEFLSLNSWVKDWKKLKSTQRSFWNCLAFVILKINRKFTVSWILWSPSYPIVFGILAWLLTWVDNYKSKQEDQSLSPKISFKLWQRASPTPYHPSPKKSAFATNLKVGCTYNVIESIFPTLQEKLSWQHIINN